MRCFRTEPHTEVEPVLIEVQPCGRAGHNPPRYETPAMPPEELRVEKAERPVGKQVRRVLVELRSENENLRYGTLRVLDFDVVDSSVRTRLERPPEDAPSAPPPVGETGKGM